ncbi:MAG: HPr family phosphocarrier protein [Termitinemataceae bacterium]|nr:MAG: HPr family phosphocarrier protein [Termitinemataceae bacterium]
MQEFSYQIKDENGIHARPAGLLVKELTAFKSKITVVNGEKSCDGKSLLSLMKLRAKQNDSIIVRAEGEDEAEASACAKKFLEENM